MLAGVTKEMVEAGLIELNKFYDVTRFALPPSAVMRRVLETAITKGFEVEAALTNPVV